MPSLSDFVNVSIALNTAPVSEPGFGIPLILSRSAAWTERTRTYTSIDGVVADFASTTPEYRAAAAMFAQIPAPSVIMIGRCANKPTQKWRITPTAVNSTKYRVTVDDLNADYTSDGSATVAEITAGLKLAIDALSLSVTTTDNATSLDVVATAAGAWHSLRPDEAAASKPLASLMAVESTHAEAGGAGGEAADLDAIQAESAAWYAICNLFNSTDDVSAIATWAETHAKLFLAATQQTLVASQALGVGSDIAQTLKTAGDVRTGLIFHPDNGVFADAALLGARLSFDPGSENWVFATLAGVTAVPLSATHVTNLKAKRVTGYYANGGKNVTFGGKTAGNQFIDVVRGRDWLVARMQTEVFALLTGPKKVPYTDRGITQVGSKIRQVLVEAARKEFISESWTLTLPKAADASSADRAARDLKNILFTATVQGAVDTVAVSGVVSA